MFVPIIKKPGHLATIVSRKAAYRFIEQGLRIISAKPLYHYHQTLTFPTPVTEAKPAKLIFNKLIKGILKFYRKNELAILYVQERRKDESIHFHVCFVFFCANSLPFAPSRMCRDFRTDIFRRWNELNNANAVHPANRLTEHEFNLDSFGYFTKALIVSDTLTKRAETNWWGVFKKQVIRNHSTAPTKSQKRIAFDGFFKKSSRNRPAARKSGELGEQEQAESDSIEKIVQMPQVNSSESEIHFEEPLAL